MYYLLEDNRIIDSNEYFKYAYAYKNGITYYNVTIKKQSENVYDLIEVGDLITEKRRWCGEEIYVTANVCSKEDELIHCFRSTLFEHDVYAIYKPNSKGDYIKVWEVKEDE